MTKHQPTDVSNASTQVQPQSHNHHPTQDEKNHFAGWNGLLWLDYMNMDPAATFEVFEAERNELESYKPNVEESQLPQENCYVTKDHPRKLESETKRNGDTETKSQANENTNSLEQGHAAMLKPVKTNDDKLIEQVWQDSCTYPTGPIMGGVFSDCPIDYPRLNRQTD